MRIISQNKAMRSAPPAVCLPQHRIYVGGPCPSCGTVIKVGPYTFDEHRKFFGAPANEPPIREPSAEYTEALKAYLAAAREREKAYGEVERLVDELGRAQQTTQQSNWNGSSSFTPPDESKVEKLSAELQAAREARAAADIATERALRTYNRTRA